MTASAAYNPDEQRLRSKVSLESRAVLQRALQLAEGDELDDEAAAEAERVLAEFRASWASNMRASGLDDGRLDSVVDEVMRLDARDLVEPARRGRARRVMSKTLTRLAGLAAVPNPACCSVPGVLCAKCTALPAPEAVRTDAADHDSPEYRAGVADLARRRAQAPTPKDPMPKQPKTTLDHARAAGWLEPLGAEQTRVDMAPQTVAPQTGDDARAHLHIRSHLAAFMPIGADGNPRMPATPAEQQRFDAGVARLKEQDSRHEAHALHRSRHVRTDGKHDECSSCGATLAADDPGGESGLCSKCRTTEVGGDRARRRMQHRAANAWREPLDKHGQQRLDEARLIRDENDAGGPDAA